MENFCAYRPTKYLDNGDINNRLKNLYRGVCYLLGQAGSTPVVPDATVDFSVNANPNTGGTTFSPNTPNLTTVIYVSTIDGSQWTSNGTTYTLYVAPYWAKPGNSGTTPGTHFVGTTDNKGLMFKVNNIKAGYLDLLNNTTFGRGTLTAVNTQNNSAFGINALATASGIGASQNTAIGGFSLTSLTIGGFNTALGHQALQLTTTSSQNLGVGYSAGKYNTTAANQIFINNLDRLNYTGDQTASPIYIQQNAVIASQILALNGQVKINDGNQAVGRVFTCTNANGQGQWAPASGGSPSLTSTYVGYGDGSNLLTGSANFAWINASSRLEVTGNARFGIDGTYLRGLSNFIGGVSKIGDFNHDANGNELAVDDPNNLAYYDNTAHTGKFAINRNNPTVEFDVLGRGLFTSDDANDNSFAVINSALDNYAFRIDNQNGHIILGANGTPYKVGIGVDAPSVALDVVGDVSVYNGSQRLYTTSTDAILGDNATSDNYISTIASGIASISASSSIRLQIAPVTVDDLSGPGTRVVTANSTGQLFANSGLVPIVMASADLTGQTIANTSIATTTPPANGTYRIGGYINVTAISASTITLQVTYMDINSNSVTQIIPLTLASTGAVGTTASTVSNSSATDIQIRAKAGTAITVKTATTGVSRTYDVGATIEFLR